MEKLKEKTTELEQLHMDGAYGSRANDEKMKELNITPIQTAIRGKRSQVEININKIDDTTYEVICPQQSVKSTLSRQRNKAYFDAQICATCPNCSCCAALPMKSGRVYYFTDADFLKKRRQENINTIPEYYRKIRSNVEATVCEFTNKFRKGQIKARGFFKTSVFAYSMAVSVNFGRIYRHLANNGNSSGAFAPISLSCGVIIRFCAIFASLSKNFNFLVAIFGKITKFSTIGKSIAF